MLDPTLVKFPHRANTDGSFDSICTNCYETIAQRPFEAELSLAEQTHICRPSDLVRLGKIELGNLFLHASTSVSGHLNSDSSVPSTPGTAPLEIAPRAA